MARWTEAGSVAALALMLGACSAAQKKAAPEPNDPNTASGEQLSKQPTSRVEELFEGRFAGVQVLRVNGGIAVRVRGGSSMLAGNEPLYVVDGMAVEAGPGGALEGINPYDIEKIEVVKDAASLTMYGSRGANGVIVIKTKRK